MKIVLIQTPWSQLTAGEFKRVQKNFTFYPPIGLMYIAAFVEKNGHSADIIDLEVESFGIEELCDKIAECDADIVGLTSTTPVFHTVQAYANYLKKRLGLPIVVGGSHVTALKDMAFTDEFDFAIVNEGEHTLVELMDCLETDGDRSMINGLIYREGGQVKVNAARAFIQDLDSLPFPARHKISPYKYTFEVPGKGFVPVASMALTRGCPFQCVFCAEFMNAGKKLRSRSAKSVVTEILEVKETFGIHHFYMLDSTLTVNRNLIEEFCHELVDRKANVTFEGQTRVNLVNKPLLTLMRKAGLVRLSFGVESSNRRVLELMRKQIQPESMKEAFRLCKELKISTLCGTMMGNPGDTKKTILETARFVRSIPEIRYAPLAIAIPYPGTELLRMAERGMHGLKLIETDYKKYSRYGGGVMEVDGMKPTELVKLQIIGLIIMHSTPRKIIGVLQHFGIMNVLYTGVKMIKGLLPNALGWHGRK